MHTMYSIGPHVHKRTSSYCVKTAVARFTPQALSPPLLLTWTAG